MPVKTPKTAFTLAKALNRVPAAACRFGLFRKNAPRLTLQQTVSAHRLDPKHALVMVNVTIHNPSPTTAKPHFIQCDLSQTAPLTNQQVERIYAERITTLSNNRERPFNWPQLAAAAGNWQDHPVVIKPGAYRQEHFQFILNGSVHSGSAFTAVNLTQDPTPVGPTAETFFNLSKGTQ